LSEEPTEIKKISRGEKEAYFVTFLKNFDDKLFDYVEQANIKDILLLGIQHF